MDVPAFKKLRTESPNPVLKNEEGFTELHIVSKRGSIDEVKKLISEGCELDAVIPAGPRKGCTALHIAIEFQQTQITKILLENGADFTLKDTNNVCPLRIAMKKNCVESVQLILQAYYTACSKINEKIKETLVENNFPINGNTKVNEKFLENFMPLHFAVDFELIDVMSILIENGIDIQAMDSTRMNALHCAVKYTQILCRGNNDHDAPPPRLVKIIYLLLKGGCDINALDNFGKTPIFYLYKTVNVLNVDVSISSSRVEDVGLRKDLIRRFTSLSPRLNMQDSEGNTILHLMAKAGYGATDFQAEADILAEYLNSGGNLNATDVSGHTALYYACGNGHVNLVKALLKHGVDVNLTSSKDLKRPLHRAIEFLQQRTKYHPRFDYDLIEELLEHGAYVDAAMADGTKPIQLASRVVDYPSRRSLMSCLFDWDCDEGNNMTEAYLKPDNWIFFNMFMRQAPTNVAGAYAKVLSLCAGILTSQDMHKFVKEEFGAVRGDIGFKHDLAKAADTFVNELDVMKTMRINERTKLYDIMRKNPKELVDYLSNRKLIEILSNSSFLKMYPIYGALLIKRIRHAIKREVLCNAARNTLLLILKLDMPHVVEKIMSHLENNDLINLIETRAFKTTPIKYKNSQKVSSTRFRLHIAVKSPYLF